MAETPQEIVNRVLREFNRYTGDGLPGEPVNAPLPVGDPQSGTWNPRKKDLREALLAALLAAGVEAERAKEEADRALAEADRAEAEADRAATNAMSVVDRAWFKTVADLLADDNGIIGYEGSEAQFIVVPGDIVEAQGFRYEVAASDAVDFDEETAGGVRLVLKPDVVDARVADDAGIQSSKLAYLLGAIDAQVRTVESKLGDWISVKDFGAKGDCKGGTDGTTTAASTTFTSASASFTSDDVGKGISITGAGVDGGVLFSEIVAVNSPTSVDLADAAVTSGTDLSYAYGTDDTAAIQAALNSANPNQSDSEVFDTNGGGIVFIPDGTYRFTDTLYIPQWVHLIGTFKGAVTGNFNPSTKQDGKGSILYADFADPNKMAVAAVGWWLTGTYQGQRIDLTRDTVGSAAYDGGAVTRSYASGIHSIVLVTDRYVRIGFGFAGAPSLSASRIGAHGFLNGIVGHSSWGVSLTELSVRAHHCSFFNFNLKAAKIEGYLTRQTGGYPPALDESNALPGWPPADAIHMPPELRFLTTCLADRFASACDYSVTLESHQRAYLTHGSWGATFSSPYIEVISVLPVHAVNAQVVMTTPRIVLNNLGFARVSSGGGILIEMPAHQGVTSFDWGSQANFGAVAKIHVVYAHPNRQPSTEVLTPNLTWSYLGGGPLMLPRLSAGERDALTNVVTGMIIHNTTSGKVQVYEGGAWVNVA